LYQFDSFILNLTLAIFVKNGYQKILRIFFWAIEPEKYTPVKSTKYG